MIAKTRFYFAKNSHYNQKKLFSPKTIKNFKHNVSWKE